MVDVIATTHSHTKRPHSRLKSLSPYSAPSSPTKFDDSDWLFKLRRAMSGDSWEEEFGGEHFHAHLHPEDETLAPFDPNARAHFQVGGEEEESEEEQDAVALSKAGKPETGDVGDVLRLFPRPLSFLFSLLAGAVAWTADTVCDANEEVRDALTDFMGMTDEGEGQRADGEEQNPLTGIVYEYVDALGN
ncbi:uncharacterized protein VTP21DRAFT_2787 [Calcarisporiella thermophila]|uniref:uncharacterized protein n=1 Tax=Calcarisporiella thermophila TaxID=911321 RepID=UPI0037421237